MLWVEWNPCRDEYANASSSGLFIAGFCLLGIEHFFTRDGWRIGIIILNIGLGVWKENK